ncbi:glycosyl transferases group 1 family protein [Lyngbya aestuarii BL J]|uniref:Glycosyl transferases group 1 family protein n=1 Tax=Lyngbya aestuarii BL J TaxID=1348334 RepID=U7QP87_9CYAN|nr:glycosyltransferase [Lyngbya aestuarii]ERT08221.1 glycosyl transferases group 1 family protein [Lyngbya aestuarii BL J]
MAKILILIGGHLCTAPRPQKEADALAAVGHEVTVRGFWFDPELVERDRLILATKTWQFLPIIDFQPAHKINNIRVRIKARIAKEKYKRFGTFSPELLGYGATAMLQVARHTQADLTIVHSEGGLWVGNQLLNEGFCVGVDFEDWFSEDLLPSARATRPIHQLKTFEHRLAINCIYCLTTSHALAEAFSEAYQVPKPTVIYNTFTAKERFNIDGKTLDKINSKLPSLHWFSQTIGPGRGLEILFKALPYLQTPVEIHLRGDYPKTAQQWLQQQVTDEWRDRIFIHPTVPNSELLSRIAEHDIGLALEQADIPSRNLTITNKLFQYLQAGLAVIATDTAGQKEIFQDCPEIGQLLTDNHPTLLAEAIENLLQNPEKLARAKAAALQAYENKFGWEKQVNLLLQISEVSLIHRAKKLE